MPIHVRKKGFEVKKYSLIRRKKLESQLDREMDRTGGEGTVRFYSLESTRGKAVHHRRFALKRFHHRYMKPKQRTYASKLLAAKHTVEVLTALRKIPGLRSNIPPTVRLVEGKKGREAPGVLLTDLTQNGRYLVLPAIHVLESAKPFYADAIRNEVTRLRAQLLVHGFTATSDSYLLQVDPASRIPIKMWIVDATGVERFDRMNPLDEK